MMRCNVKKDDDVGDHYGLWIIMVSDGICVALVCFTLLSFLFADALSLSLWTSLPGKSLSFKSDVDVRMSISITW